MEDKIAQWVWDSRTGNLDAFGRLVTAYEASVSVLLTQMTGTSAGANSVREAVADVFAAAWRDLGCLRTPPDFPDWLFRRAVKTAASRDGRGRYSLPSLDRIAVRLHFTRRSEPEEAARLLGCSVSEYWALLYDGCQRLAGNAQGSRGNQMYQTWLIPYIEGTLHPEQRVELEARFADAPPLQAEMERLLQVLPDIERVASVAETDTADTESIWPALKQLLEGKRPERPRMPLAGWIACFALAALLAASAVENRALAEKERQADAKWRRELRVAPRIVFHRDNRIHSALAARLRARAEKVTAERRAIRHRPPETL